ncbi:S1C family serine protease [Acidipila sp. EB88]|uniref:S1C family serine protease n=1 Tax=Acidipila sp. EB88 TaxID=2305226 RepID=UPI000F5DD825|nr:PDZ domain-containing protein [Acidipila sp. EB88]RRA48110.1 PDZ domain-containing protein [Acidipila sp. EB88]
MTLSLVAVVAVLALHCPATQARVVHGGASAAAAQESSHSALPFHVLRRPGYLGVSLRDLDAAEATRLHRRGAMGAMIITVDRDAPAWAAGLRPEDVILELNGQGVDGVEALRHRLRDFQPGDTITLRVRRRDDEMTYSVLLGDQDKVAQSALTRHLHTPPGSTLLADTPLSSDATNPSPPMSLMSPAPTRGITSTLFDALIPGSTYTGLEVDPLTPNWPNSSACIPAADCLSPWSTPAPRQPTQAWPRAT